MPLTFVQSTRGKPLLVVDGYLFRKDYGGREKTAWRCLTKGCKARVDTKDDEHGVSTTLSTFSRPCYAPPLVTSRSSTFQLPPEHCHSPDDSKIKKREKSFRVRVLAKPSPHQLASSLLMARMVGALEFEPPQCPRPESLQSQLPGSPSSQENVSHLRRNGEPHIYR